jgi:broad-specificity NMP kinase
MNKVTSIALLNTNGMQRISITYSSIDENGVIIEDNKRINRVVVDEDKLELVDQLYEFADSIVQTNK